MRLRTHIKRQRHILTSSGMITFERYILLASDAESAEKLEKLGRPKTIAPLDELLRIDNLPFKMTVAVMLDVAREGIQSSSYKEAAEKLREKYSQKTKTSSERNTDSENDETKEDGIICTSRVREVTNYIGKMVFLENCRKARRAKWEYENCQILMPKTEEDVLYLMTDGAALNTRQKVKQDDGNESSWKENKLGVVFRASHIRRWTVKNEDGTQEERHSILKREYSSYTGGIDEFKWHLLGLALRNGYGKVNTFVIISDGSHWITGLRKELFPDAVHILDLFHLKENVFEYFKGIFKVKDESKGKNKDQADLWTKNVCEQLEAGKWKEALDELEQFKDISLPDNTVDLPEYLNNHNDMLDYPAYINKGYFVGSGIIESGHKTVMQVRLKGPGMRWNVPTARYVLALREKLKSELWEKDVILYVKNQMLELQCIPERLPRNEDDIKKAEDKDIEQAKVLEKQVWKKKRIRNTHCQA